MGIVAFCPNGHRIKVKDQFAGKKGICPTCQARFRIPHRQAQAMPARRPDDSAGLPTARVASLDPHVAAMLPAAHSPAAATDADAVELDVALAEAEAEPAPAAAGAGRGERTHAALDERPDLAWCVAERGGAPSAPLDADALRTWLDSGAGTSDHVVWRADWPDWRPLEEVFPDALARGPRGRP